MMNEFDRSGALKYLSPEMQLLYQRGELPDCVHHLQQVLRAVVAYVPGMVARACLDEPELQTLRAETCEATMMFADISGFTSMSERLGLLGREGAEVITGIVNDYFEGMLSIAARYQGDVLKFGGDALLVGFLGENRALRAARAALEMQQAMQRFGRFSTPQGDFNLRMKVGLGSGMNVFASLGSQAKMEFGVLGPALNRMARCEQRADAGEVILDQATADALPHGAGIENHSPGFYRLLEIQTGASMPFIPATPVAGVLPGDLSWLIKRLDAMAPYLPVGILERIVASSGRILIGGEHRLVTILFVNIFGLDELIAGSAANQQDEIVELINRHFITIQEIVAKYGGIINKLDSYSVGYRVMIVFGAPVAHENDPENAILASLEIQQASQSFQRIPLSEGIFSLQVRSGVNTGYVFAGTVGSELRQEYSVMGDEVNLAARLMGVAAGGQILVSQSTARYLTDLFELEMQQPISLKGKSQPVPYSLVLRSTWGRAVDYSSRREFFGRVAELSYACALLDDAANANGAILDLVGEAGVGKSRFIVELVKSAKDKGFQIGRGEGVSFGQRIPYLPWLSVLTALLELDPGGDNQSQQARRLQNSLKEANLQDWSPIVGSVLGIYIEENELTAPMDAERRQRRFFDVVLQLIQYKASQQPILLILDDMYWADSVSFELAAYLARNIQNLSLLFIVVRRPGIETPAWRVGERYFLLQFDALDDSVSLEVARSTLGGGALSPALVQLIVERAQGNPLFVEEIVLTLKEAGSIKFQTDPDGEGVWDLENGLAPVNVPTTLNSLIMSRIDRLEDASRRLIQVAAVIGISFQASILSRVYPYKDLEESAYLRLGKLIQQDLLLFSPPDEYTFRHNLVQEVAYTSLPFALRRELHVRVAEDLESHNAGEIAKFYGVLAHHFDEGRVYEKAFNYLIKAGDVARKEFANQAALGHYRRCLDLYQAGFLSEPTYQDQVYDVYEAMGDVLQLISLHEEAIQSFLLALERPRATPRKSADVLCKISRTHIKIGRYDDALETTARAEAALEKDQSGRESVEMAQVLTLRGMVYTRRGDLDVAIRNCEQALEVLSGQDCSTEIMRTEAELNNILGTSYVNQGNYPEATRCYQRGMEISQASGDLYRTAYIYNNLAFTAWVQGELLSAGAYLQQSLEISQRIGDNHAVGLAMNNLGVISFTLGKSEEALGHYHKTLRLRQRIGDSYGVAQTCSNLGECYLGLKHYAEARQYLEQAAAVFEDLESEGELSEVYRLLAEVELVQGELSVALRYAERARQISISAGNPDWQGVAERVLGRIAMRSGEYDRALKAFEDSIDHLTTAGNQVELARSSYEFGLALIQQPGKQPEARHHLLKAIELFTIAGAEKDAEAATEILENL